LKCSFIEEANLPRSEGKVSSIKDEVVPFFPDLLAPNNEDFHEEINIEWLPHLFHHGMKLKIKSPVDTQMLPTPCTKRSRKE
jgi:hypothetical protein